MSSFLALIPMTNQQLFKHFKNIPAKSWFCQSDNQVSKLFSNQPSKQARKPITQQPSKQASAIRQASKQVHQKIQQASKQTIRQRTQQQQARKPITQQPSKQASAIRQASKQAHQTSNQAQTEALSLFRVCCLKSKAYSTIKSSKPKEINKSPASTSQNTTNDIW